MGPSIRHSRVSICFTSIFHISVGELITAWATPVSLAWHKIHASSCRVHFAGEGIDDLLLRLEGTSGVTLIVYSNHLIAQLKSTVGAGCREGLVNCEDPLSIDCIAEVDSRSTGNIVRRITPVKLNDLMVCKLESWQILVDMASQIQTSHGVQHIRNIRGYVGNTVKCGWSS